MFRWVPPLLNRIGAYLVQAERLGHMGGWALNVATGEIFWSEEHSHILGLDPREPKPPYPGVLKVLHPEDRVRVQEALERAIRERTTFDLECRIVRPDGTVRDIRSVAHRGR
jgi:hypothetical protein